MRPHELADEAWGLAEPDPVPWHSGGWSLERRGDEIADVRRAGRLVLRMIRLVARDRDWNTVPATVRGIESGDTSLRIRLALEGLGAALDADLEVTAANSLVVDAMVRSRSDFLRNRIGLVVLHPPNVTGERLEVVGRDGDGTVTTFPTSIAPHQPAKNIERLRWTHDGAASELVFSGDVFETEDQRNWTDASFKTYSTPLDLPFPVRVRAGERIRQSVQLTSRVVAGPAPAPGPARTDVPPGTTVPVLQLGASTAVERHLRHVPEAAALLVELDLRSRRWRAALARAIREAGARPLDVRLVASSARDVDAAVGAVHEHRVTRIGVFDASSHVTEPELWQALTASLDRHSVQAAPVGGARTHFTELNREHHRLPRDLPALTFSITPQMHARERSQLIESLAMQRLVAENAVRIADGRPVHVGPVTLRPRLNAVAISEQTEPPGDDMTGGYGPEQLPSATDPRQQGRALAAWTVASAAALSIPGVATVTYFETSGPRGLGDQAGEYPVAEAVRLLHGLAGAPLVDASVHPDGVAALAAEVNGSVRVLAANVTAEPRTIDTPLGVVNLASYAVECRESARHGEPTGRA